MAALVWNKFILPQFHSARKEFALLGLEFLLPQLKSSARYGTGRFLQQETASGREDAAQRADNLGRAAAVICTNCVASANAAPLQRRALYGGG